MRWIIAILILSLSVSALPGPLEVSEDNPRYFEDGDGNIVYLTGSHTWNILQSVPREPYTYTDYLDYMQDKDYNFLRLWANKDTYYTPQDDGSLEYKNPGIFQRTGPGTATDGLLKFDLTSYNEEYFQKLRAVIQAADDRGIYVGIMLFEGWWNADESYRPGAWNGHPYNPLNNINSLSGTTTYNVHTLDKSNVVALQKQFIEEVIDNVNEFDNIIFEISNEDKYSSEAWQLEMMNHIKQYESSKPKQHPVWITSKSWGTSDDWIWDSSCEAMSPTRLLPWNQGADEPYVIDPPLHDGSKVVILDTDHFLGGDFGYDWSMMIMKGFFRGYNPIVMDPYLYHPTWVLDDDLLPAATNTMLLAQMIDLKNMEPSDSTSDCSTKYCLVNPGVEYLVYQPSHSSFTVGLVPGDYDYEWFDPSSGDIEGTGTITATGTYTFNIPSSIPADAVIHLTANEGIMVIDDGSIDKSKWSIAYVDSEELVQQHNPAENAIDDRLDTIWHTEWSASDPPHPHEIQIDLGAIYSLNKMVYYPRTDGPNGNIEDYEIHASLDGSDWVLAYEGAFASNLDAKEVMIDTFGRYIKLVALSEVNSNPWTSAADISVMGTPATCSDIGGTCCSNCESDSYSVSDCATCCLGSCGSVCDGLMLLYHMDNGALDSSGNENSGTVNGPVLSEAKFDSGYRFDGVDDHIDVLDDETIRGAQLTISVWIKPDVLDKSMTFATKRYTWAGDPWNSYVIDTYGDGFYRFCLSQGIVGSQKCVQSTSLMTSDWAHIAGTFDGSTMRLYINANQERSMAFAGPIGYSAEQLRIGRSEYDDGRWAFDGMIDELVIWNRALTQAEISSFYSNALNCDSCPSIEEVIALINDWLAGNAEMTAVLAKVNEWLGCA